MTVTVNDARSEPAAQCDLLLTTFPGHKSQNVGDNLISYSAIKMITSRNANFKPITAFREQNLDKYEDGVLRNIIAPGFSVSDGVYPKLFGLYSDRATWTHLISAQT